MLTMRFSLSVALLLATLSTAAGQDYAVEIIEAPPEADGVSAEIQQQLSAKGFRVKRDSSRTVCEFWFCKQWTIEANVETDDQRLYPFAPGQLVGLIHFPRRGADFREQSISSGWYTLRYELQPIDGNHVGTSPTRDFLLMVAADQDEVGKQWDNEELQAASAEAAGSSHPAMLCLQTPDKDAKPAVRHNEEQDWWILHVLGKGVVEGKERDMAIDVVVAGHAAE